MSFLSNNWPSRGSDNYLEQTKSVIEEIDAGLADHQEIIANIPTDITEFAATVAGIQDNLDETGHIALSGIEAALGQYGPLRNMRAGVVNVLDYGADATGVADSRAAIINAQAVANPYFPPGDYRISEVIPGISNRTWTFAPGARLINDRSNATLSKQACILAGNMHPSYISGEAIPSYALDGITAGDTAVDCTTTADAENFAVDELVIVGDSTLNGGVSRHAQLTKITAISSGTITVRDPIAVAITSPLIWKLDGTDADLDQPIFAVENFNIIGGAFEGRSALATKSAVYIGTFRDMTLATHIFFSANMLTHTLIENLSGQYSGRYLEFANNSYDVVARNWDGTWVAPTGDDTAVLPIHLGEQPYQVLLDTIRCHIPAGYAESGQLAQLKGSGITVRNPDWQMNGSHASVVGVTINDSLFAGYPHRDVVFDGGRLSAPGKFRILAVGEGSGGVADTNPVGVDVRGTVLDGTVTSEAIWFYSGSNHRCSARNRTGTAIKIASPCQYPDLTGYQGGVKTGGA